MFCGNKYIFARSKKYQKFYTVQSSLIKTSLITCRLMLLSWEVCHYVYVCPKSEMYSSSNFRSLGNTTRYGTVFVLCQVATSWFSSKQWSDESPCILIRASLCIVPTPCLYKQILLRAGWILRDCWKLMFPSSFKMELFFHANFSLWGIHKRCTTGRRWNKNKQFCFTTHWTIFLD